MIIEYTNSKLHAHIDVTVPKIKTVITNPRNKMTGLAIDYGFTETGTGYIRWSIAPGASYTDWEKADQNQVVKKAYSNFHNFCE